MGVNGNGHHALLNVPIVNPEAIAIQHWFATIQFTGWCTGDTKHTLLFVGGVGSRSVCQQCRKVYTLTSIASQHGSPQVDVEFNVATVSEFTSNAEQNKA